MKLLLTRSNKIDGKAGDIVEVSPSGFDYLTSLGIAVPVTEARERVEVPEVPETIKAPVKTAAKKTKSSAKK